MRIFLLLVIIVVMTLILTSCGKYSPEIKTKSTAETSHSVETNSEISGEIRTTLDRVLDICGFTEGQQWRNAADWQKECLQILDVTSIIEQLEELE